MKRETYHGNWQIRIAGILLCLVLITTYMMTGLYARYTYSESMEDSARVAIMAEDVIVEVNDNIPICPGETSIIPLTITNEKNGKVCEVAQQYTFTIRNLENNIPLEWNVYSNDQCTNLATQLQGTLKAGTAEQQEYWIRVEWPADENDEAYAFEVDALEIVVSVEQID